MNLLGILGIRPRGKVSTMPWQEMRIPGKSVNTLPGDRGRYLLWLKPPLVEDEGHYVHFSWSGESYRVRDYIKKQETGDLNGMSALDVWNAAEDRIPCTGELYRPVNDYAFWIAKLTELSEKREEADGSERSADDGGAEPPRIERARNQADYYDRFKRLWAEGDGFEVIERTVGCSARYRREPLLWVYPRYFQPAPEGKGNAHFYEVQRIIRQHFPTTQKRAISFNSQGLDWDNFERMVKEIKKTIQQQ